MSNIILASESYLKNQIMEKSGIAYTQVAADIDETIFDHLSVGERVVELAKRKCEVVTSQNPDNIVIAADTLTANQEGELYTKISHGDDPIEHALRLSGQTIEVYTGCCIYTKELGFIATLTTAAISYQQFSREHLERLVNNDNPSIRSGALGIYLDSPGFVLAAHINGSFTGAFGLPMEFVNQQLESIGYFQDKSTI